MFIDTARIKIRSGDGGNGAVSFHREKYVPAGGPDGGDGGKGGDIIFVTDGHLSTLMDFRYKREYVALNGDNGSSRRKTGKDAENVVIRVPRGTLIRDGESNALLCDLSGDEPFVAARGARGGYGNARFATPTRQAPHFAKGGFKGVERELVLELKLLADVGLCGFPNVGKSTLLSVISSARPKIADYHFTTLTPNLGVVSLAPGQSFVVADIPGLIEGASEGAGLGHAFLRHIDRCRLLVHVVDASGCEGRDPVEDIEKINSELENYSPELSTRPQILAANKTDIPNEEAISRLRKYADEKGLAIYEISAATRKGVDELTHAVWNALSELPPVKIYEPEPVFEEIQDENARRETNIRVEDGVYHVEGDWVENLMKSVYINDYESLMYLQRVLRKAGVFDLLVKHGAKEGDEVHIYGFEFDYVD